MVRFFEKRKLSSEIIIGLLLAIVVIIGLYYRVFFAYHVNFTNLYAGTSFQHDEFYYNQMAVNFLQHGFFGYEDVAPNAYVTPGYPLFLIIIYAIFGVGAKSVFIVKIVQVFLSALSILLVFFIGKKISNQTVGLIAAIFVAFYPPLILYSRSLLTETLYIFFFLIYFLVQLIALEKDQLRWHFIAGLLIACAILVRPLLFFLMPLPYIYQYFTNKRDLKKILVEFGVFLVGFVLLMMPWWIRNILTLHQFIFLCTQSNPFYFGIAPDCANLPSSNNETFDGIKLIFHNFISCPIKTIKWFTINKLNIIFGSQDYYLPEGVWYLSSLSLLHYIIVICGAIGATMSIFKREIRLVTIFMILNIAFQLLFIPIERYALPLIPMLSICAAYMLWYLFDALKNERGFRI